RNWDRGGRRRDARARHARAACEIRPARALLIEIGTYPMLETAAGLPMLVALYALAATSPSAAPVPVLDGEIRALAIAGDRVAAIRRDQVVVLRASGEMLGRLDHEHGIGPATASAKKRRASDDEVLDLAGI